MAKSRTTSLRKRTPRRSSKKTSRRSSKKRQVSCSKIKASECLNQMDRFGQKRCRVNIKSGSCERLPMKYRSAATVFSQGGIRKDVMPRVGKLSADIKNFNPFASPSRREELMEVD